MIPFYSKCRRKDICFCMPVYACMFFSCSVAQLFFSQWHTHSGKSIWNATAIHFGHVHPASLPGGCVRWHGDSLWWNTNIGIKQDWCFFSEEQPLKLSQSWIVRNNQLKEKHYVTVLLMLILFSEFVGRDRPRQLALNGSTTEYQMKNVAHDTEYVLTLYVLFGSVVGPGITATFRTCEYQCSICLLLINSTEV